MAGNVNALGLILSIVLTGWALRRNGLRPGNASQVIGGCGVAVVLAIFLSAATTLWWDRGGPGMQWLVPCLGLAGILITAKGKTTLETVITEPPVTYRAARMSWGTRIAAVAQVLLAFALTAQFMAMVSGDRYTGNPDEGGRNLRARLMSMRKHFLWMAEEDNSRYPAGWLTDAPFANLFAKPPPSLTGRRVETWRLWHTPLTTLYGKRYHSAAIWYPGGTLREAAERLEWRDR